MAEYGEPPPGFRLEHIRWRHDQYLKAQRRAKYPGTNQEVPYPGPVGWHDIGYLLKVIDEMKAADEEGQETK